VSKITPLPFWERTKKLIKAHKITQEKFASYIGVVPGTFKNWLYYGIVPDVITACNIADALGVSVEYLVRGTDGKAMEERENDTLQRKKAASEIKKMALQIKNKAALVG